MQKSHINQKLSFAKFCRYKLTLVNIFLNNGNVIYWVNSTSESYLRMIWKMRDLEKVDQMAEQELEQREVGPSAPSLCLLERGELGGW